MKLARALRWFAIAIAVAALIDPSMTSRRRADAVVSVIAGDVRVDSAVAVRATRALDAHFTVIRAPFPAASATVVAGMSLPPDAAHAGGNAFAVTADSTTPFVTVMDVRAPARASLHSRVAIDVTVASSASGNDSVDVTLLDGAAVLDRAVIVMRDAARGVTLSYVPARTGAARLRVQARVRGDDVAARADVVTHVSETPWQVLFYDARPSWMSTFVRRALEQDARFGVTSRTITSRELATEFGQPPRGLADAAVTRFDAIIVGAPEALTNADVVALEDYMRARGGAVLLLLDRQRRGAWERVVNVQQWQFSAGAPQTLSATVSELRATELMWPATMPPLARTVAMNAALRAPVVWRMPVGGGTLVVSGALDAWRYRDPGVASFDAFWTTLIGGLAEAAPDAVALTAAVPVAKPGAWVNVAVTARDAALTAAREESVAVAAQLVFDSIPVRLWPAAAPGELHARVRAPSVAGSYTLVAGAGAARSAVQLLVANDARQAIADGRDLMRAWATSRAGVALDARNLDALADSIESRLGAARTRERWHPMRSPWWILPFVLALGGEWLIRRRRGLL